MWLEARTEGSEHIFEDITRGTIHLRVDCDDGTFNHSLILDPVPGETLDIILEYSWNGTPVQVDGATSLTWWNANGSMASQNDSVSTIEDQTGWLLIENGSLYLLTADMDANITEAGVQNLSIESHGHPELRVIHEPSGHHVHLNSESGWFNSSLPFLQDGEEWTFHLMSDSHVGMDGLADWLQASDGYSPVGESRLSMEDTPFPGSEPTATWWSQYIFPSGMGSTLLPGWGLPLQVQIDLYLDSDQGVFLELLNGSSWSTSNDGLCCSLDGVDMQVEDLEFSAWIADDGTWGWNESANLSAQRNHVPTALLGIVLADDPRQAAPLSVLIPEDWEYRSSSRGDWVNGSPRAFSILRNASSVSGEFLVSIGENTAPSASTAIGKYLRFDADNELIHDSQDHGIGELECRWNLSSDTGEMSIDAENASVHPEQLGWTVSSVVDYRLICTDDHGLVDQAEGNFTLDGDTPWATSVSTNASCDGEVIGTVDILTCTRIGIPSGERVYLHTTAGDNTSSATIEWLSNKSQGWNDEGDLVSVVFHQGSDVNQPGMSTENRSLRRNTSHHSLTLILTDEVGHTMERSWDVEVLDGSAPSIRPDLMIEDAGRMSPSNQPRLGEELWLELGDSFDDISPATTLVFSLSIDDEPFLDELSLSEAENISLPSLSVGNHRILIEAVDEAGNIANYNLDLQVHPLDVVDLKILDVKHPENGVAPGSHEVVISIINEGARGGWMRLCIGSDCIDRAMPTATPFGPGEDEVTLIWNAQDDEVLDLTVEWENTNGQWESYAIKTGVVAEQPWSTMETLSFLTFAVISAGVVIILLRRASLRQD